MRRRFIARLVPEECVGEVEWPYKVGPDTIDTRKTDDR